MKVLIILSVLVASTIAANLEKPCKVISRTDLPIIKDCDKPVCKVNETVHFPSRNRDKFWQCAPETAEPCEDGTWAAVEMPCPKGLVFNYWEQACDWACIGYVDPCDPGSTSPPTGPTTEGTPPPAGNEECEIPVCRVNDTVLYPHPQANKYYQCVPGTPPICEDGEWVPVEMICVPGLVFNYWEQACDWPCADYESPCGTVPLPPPSTKPPTQPTPPPTTTTRPTTTTQPPTTTTTQAPTTPTTEGTPPPAGNEECEIPVCRVNDTVLYPHPQANMYYQCVPGIPPVCEDGEWIPVDMVCPPNLVFNYWEQACDWPCNDYESPCGTVPLPPPSTKPPTQPTPPPTTKPPTQPTPPPTTQSTTTTQPTTTIDSGSTAETPECEIPACKVNQTVLLPHGDRTKFIQCAPSEVCEDWLPVELPCPKNLVFNYWAQACDYACLEYQDPCGMVPLPPPTAVSKVCIR